MTEETALRILKAIEPSLPMRVVAWKVRCGPDWTGDASVHVVAVLPDESEMSFEKSEIVRDEVWNALCANDGDLLVYLLFHTIADELELERLEEEEALEEEADEIEAGRNA